MHTAIRFLILACVFASASSLYGQPSQSVRPPVGLPDCGSPVGPPVHDAFEPTTAPGASLWSCVPPYETPTYVPPPDDSVALGALLEAAGYSGAGPATGGAKTIAAGNFCGDQQKELFVLTNVVEAAGRPPRVVTSKNVSALLQGPTPNFLTDLRPLPEDDPGGQWRAAAAANLDPSQPYDQIVAFRNISRPESNDLVVVKVATITGPPNHSHCGDSFVFAAATVGDVRTQWVGAAVGNFDGTGRKRIALLDRTGSKLSLVELNQGTLSVVFTQSLDQDLPQRSNWRVLVAGDIDHDGVDELVAARDVSDNQNPTIVAFKWNGSKFVPLASSGFGNNGNSKWVAGTAGDFNADGRYAIVLVKNEHSNFAVLDLPPGATELEVRATDDLDSVQGQPWTSLAATDWLGGDQGAAELIAIRAVTRPYRTNVFVYGNPFHRVPRDTGLAGTKSQWDQHLSPGFSYFTPDVSDLKVWLRGTHTNVFNWFLGVNVDPPDGMFSVHDYAGLVKFLSETRNWGVDGKQLRVWVTLGRPKAAQKPDAPKESCSLPEDTRPLTSWNALDYFAGDFSHDYDHLSDDDKIAACRDMPAWAAVIGRLAQDFPHLVALGIDDFSDSLDTQSSSDCVDEFHLRMQFNEDCLAVIESRLRSQAPWLNFVPTVYYDYFRNRFSAWADLGLTLDSMQFFFRNEKNGECIDHSLNCERTVNNAPDEIRDMHQLLPGGRKLQVGMYFAGCQACSTNAPPEDQYTPPQVRYDYDLARIALDMPIVGGATAYGLQTPPWVSKGAACGGQDLLCPCTGSECMPNCTEFNFLDDTVPPGDAQSHFEMWGTDRYCALQKAYGGKPQLVAHADLTASGPTAASQPAAYFDPIDGTHHVIYRSGNGHLHEIWWTSGAPGQGDLTPNGPEAVDNPAAYFVVADNTQHVVYRSSDGHLRELVWSGSNSPARRDLTPNGSQAVGSPAAYFDPVEGTNHVIYRSADGHLHEIWWGAVPLGQGDLTPQGPTAADDPTAYFVAADNTHHVFYRSSDGHLRELVWSGPSSPARRDLTPNGSLAVGSPSAYFLAWEGTQQVIYRGGDAHIHEIWSGPGTLGSGDITPPEVGSPAEGNPSSYSVDADGTSHVFYRSQDGHIHELLWTKGAVTHNDLTGLIDAPKAVGDPVACYFAEEGAHHVFYRSSDGHVHELRWSY